VTALGRPGTSLDLVVRGATVVGPRRIGTADIGIRDGRIVALGMIAPSGARRSIEADGLLALPGAIDGHTHLAWEKFPAGERTIDDYHTGTAGAAVGGITTIVDYVRQGPDTTLQAMVDARRELASRDAFVDFGFHIVPTDQGPATLAEVAALVPMGLPSFKLFLHRTDDAWLLAMSRAVGAAGGLLMLHCETAAVIDEALGRLEASGLADARHWAEARPPGSEHLAVQRAIAFAQLTGTPMCLVHLSTGASLAAVAAAKRRGLPVHAETRPAYLMLTADRYGDPAPRHLWATGSPPLRDAASVEAVWEGIRRGTVSTIASDHAAYTIEQKQAGERDLRRLPVGLPSLETQVGAIYARGVGEGRISLRRFVDVTATNPARLLGLYPRKGVLAVGSDADIVLIDPARRHTVHAGELHGRAGYEPLDGQTYTGWPVLTISRGDVIAEEGALLGKAGRGRFLPRSGPLAATVRTRPGRAPSTPQAR
jgi:dihydropyrimidinase